MQLILLTMGLSAMTAVNAQQDPYACIRLESFMDNYNRAVERCKDDFTAKCLTKQNHELYWSLRAAKWNEDKMVNDGLMDPNDRCKLDGPEIFYLSYVTDGYVKFDHIDKAHSCLSKRCDEATACDILESFKSLKGNFKICSVDEKNLSAEDPEEIIRHTINNEEIFEKKIDCCTNRDFTLKYPIRAAKSKEVEGKWGGPPCIPKNITSFEDVSTVEECLKKHCDT